MKEPLTPPNQAPRLTAISRVWDVMLAATPPPRSLWERSSGSNRVVLLDTGLPGMDGYEVARRLREQESLRNTLLVAVTGYGKDADRRYSREATLDYHLTKPVRPETLQQLLLAVSVDHPLPC